MTGTALFSQLRRWRFNLSGLLASGLIILLAGPVRYSLNPDGGYLIAIVAQIPLVNAIILQASAVSSLSSKERLSARSLKRFRVANYVLVSVVGAVVLGGAASFLNAEINSGPGAIGPFAVIRNLCALIGAAFIGASLLGPSLGWTLPTAWAVLPYLLLTQSSGRHEILTLVTQPSSSFPAFSIAVATWAIGLLLVGAARNDIFDLWRLPGALLRLFRPHISAKGGTVETQR